jgi:hypothetical protein
MVGYTCYQERQEERQQRLQEYQELTQQIPPNITMIPERQYSRQTNRMETIIEEQEESI